jgi:peptidyl-dipeptidase A
MKIALCSAAVSLALLLGSCSNLGEPGPTGGPHDLQLQVQAFLDEYMPRYRELYAASAEAEWAANTRIIAGDTETEARQKAANEALAAFSGSVRVIELARSWLRQRDDLTPLQTRQLEVILFKAGGNPQTVSELVKERIAAEAEQTQALYGYTFRLDGREITPNEIDRALAEETDLDARRKVWEASKEVGLVLRGGLIDLRRLRNECVRALGFPDFFSYMASEYGMSTPELAELIERLNRELRPLFRELHTWARYELARRHAQMVPDLIPAHWLPNRWGQDWSDLVQVEGFDLDAALESKSPEWVVEQAERFYVSLGFEPLPASFWQKSSLYPVAADAGFKKNTHASAWHMDLVDDVRSLMSVEPNTRWYETTHHELGHIYYYRTYSNPEVPLVLREGANRAYHEAMGSLMGLAAMQPRFIAGVGLPTGDARPDPIRLLLKEALNYVVFIPWSAGTMFGFEKELYADELSSERWNQRWWELVARYQGIAPPAPRGERFCDAATKTHVNDDPAGYYDYALSFVILFQLHDHIARQILGEDPRDTNYFGRAEVGDFLRTIMRPGSSRDWREVLREATGSELTARPMLEYFEPLRLWLLKENAGRKYTLESL